MIYVGMYRGILVIISRYPCILLMIFDFDFTLKGQQMHSRYYTYNLSFYQNVTCV
jgi:hypothetical protein